MIQKRSFLFLLSLVILIGAPAYAETAAILNVSVDRGTPIALSAPAANVFIANPDVADIQVMSPTSVMVFGKKTGETTLMATDSAGRTLLNRTVVVSQDLSDLRHELATAIPGNKINVESVPDGIVLTGSTRDSLAVEDARKIASRYLGKDGVVINRVQVLGSNQIMLRVRFAEVSRSVDNSFGIDWDNTMNFAGFAFSLATGAQVVNILGNSSIPPSLTPIRPNNPTLALPNGLIGAQHQGSRLNINGFLDALQQDGLATILAEPNLTAMSGETANFLAGGQFPIPVPQQNGTISIQFQPYGISLEFTPTLIGENRINLHVKPEVSELTTVGEVTIDNITVPALTTRKAETTVELGSGQSFAIAGLLNNNQAQTVNKYPFIGDMPIIGALFRSTEFQNDQSELVVVITPYIVKSSTSEQAMALPMDGYSPPSDSEMLLGLRNSSGDPNARPISGGVKAAPVAPSPNPDISMIDPNAIQPLPAVSTTTLSNIGADLPPDNGARNDTLVPAVTTTALGNLGVDPPPESAARDAAPTSAASTTLSNLGIDLPPENDAGDNAPAPAAVPVMPVSPVSATATPIAKASGSSSSSNGFILE